MKPINIFKSSAEFEVLKTGRLSQVAVMTLQPGASSGDKMEAHENSEQTLLVVEGEIEGQMADENVTLKAGEFVLIPAGTPHRFTNKSDQPVVTFNVYAPPEYPADTKE